MSWLGLLVGFTQGMPMIASKPIVHAAVLTDHAGNIISWSERSEHLFGYTAAQAMGKPLVFLLTPEAAREYAERWPQPPRKVEAIQVYLARPDGHRVGAALTLVPQLEVDGRADGCIAMFATLLEQDLTETVMVGQTPMASMINVLAGTFYVINAAGHFVLWNKNLENIAGMSPDEMIQIQVLDMFDDHDRPIIAEKMREVFEEGKEVVVEAYFVDRHGKRTPYLMCGTRIICGGLPFLCGMGLDTSDHHAQQARLRLRERALHAASNGIIVTSCRGRDNPIEYVNPAFEQISGYTAAELPGRDSRFMAAPGLDQDERARLREAIEAKLPARVVFCNKRKDGEMFWDELAITPVTDEADRVTHFIGVINDVTAQMQRTAALEHEVNHDALTGLPNRTLMWDRLDQALHFAQRNKSMVATVLIDLNGFKLINDTWGHEASDAVLVTVAARLASSVRDIDTVARLSGDEFVVVLTNQPSLRFTIGMVERLRQSLSTPVPFHKTEIHVGASMGVSVFPNDGGNAFELVRASDAAMYHAKPQGNCGIHFYSDEMKVRSEAKQRFETTMRAALDRNELFLLYQPRCCVRTGRVVAVEALLRWRHPDKGVLLPHAFLSDAEENGLIVPIGQRVIDMTCELLRELQAGDASGLIVSVNASQREFSRQQYLSGVTQRLHEAGVNPGNLELEFKEDQLVQNLSLGGEVAAEMNRLGMRMAIDSFGYGVSNLGYLHKHHVDHIKLNRNARSDLNGDPRHGELAKALIDIGHNLHIGVVAQGVETADQMAFLKLTGCDEAQGRFVSEPLTRAALRQLLQSAPA